MRVFFYILTLILFCCLINKTQAQKNKIHIEIGKRKIALNEAFTIKVVNEGKEDIKVKASQFPKIKGLEDQSVSTSRYTNTINGIPKTTKEYEMTYYPIKEGKFTLPDFEIIINNKPYTKKGFTITVIEENPNLPQLIRFSEEDFIDEDLKNITDDVFFSLAVNKNQIYVGEGVTISLAIYLSENAPIQLADDAGLQIEKISQQLKPANCWEENFDISEAIITAIEINGKSYNQVKVYQATFFPFNQEHIIFPSVKFEVDKREFDKEKKQMVKKRLLIYSRKKTIFVKDLPNHPLKDKVAVGTFYLREGLSKLTYNTGESFNFNFILTGEGNISSINSPTVDENKAFDFYPPNIQQYVNRRQGKILGRKVFSYQIIPKESGEYAFSNYFEWIYFNPVAEKYDTLRPRNIIKISGKNIRDVEIASYKSNPFYSKIEDENNEFVDNSWKNQTRLIMEIITFAMIVITTFLAFKR